MEIETKAEVKRVYIRTAKNGATIADLALLIPTTVMVDRDTGETRQDTIDAFIYGDRGEQWDGFTGKVRVKGDLRVNRYQKDGVWVCKPEIAISSIYKVGHGKD
jgi:single-stranded DNA-binding protein